MSTPSPVRPIRAKIVTSAPAISRIAAAPVTAPGRDVGEAAGRGVGTPGTVPGEGGGGMSFMDDAAGGGAASLARGSGRGNDLAREDEAVEGSRECGGCIQRPDATLQRQRHQQVAPLAHQS